MTTYAERLIPGLPGDDLDRALAHPTAWSVSAAWCGLDAPEEWVSRAQWIRLFAMAGYAVDGQRTPLPAASLVLYRGAPRHRRRGLAWTSDRDRARYFAGTEGTVWQALVEPSRLLEIRTLRWRNENEHIVDTRGLEVAR
jgi:hypothetical protein